MSEHHHHHPHGEGHVCCGQHGAGDTGCCGHHHAPEPQPEPEQHGCGDGCASCSIPELQGRAGDMQQVTVTPQEEEFLAKLAQTPYLPLAQFILTSSWDDDLINVALSPVYMEIRETTLEEIHAIAQVLHSLEEKNLISLDYGKPLKGYEPTLYYESVAFHLLEKTVEEGMDLPGALFDDAMVEMGSIALTPLGQVVVDQLDYV